MQYMHANPALEGVFAAWDTAHKVGQDRPSHEPMTFPTQTQELINPLPLPRARWGFVQTNNSQLSAVVLTTLTSLLRLISSAPHSSEPEPLRRLLGQYGQHLDRALNPGRNDVTTAALRLACVVVAFADGKFAKRLWSCFGWQTKVSPLGQSRVAGE